jgi:hypothetical protein
LAGGAILAGEHLRLVFDQKTCIKQKHGFCV